MLDVPTFFEPTHAGLTPLAAAGSDWLRKGKTTQYCTSAAFKIQLFARPNSDPTNPESAFKKLLEELMLGHFCCMGHVYGVETLLPEARNIWDLAFCSAR